MGVSHSHYFTSIECTFIMRTIIIILVIASAFAHDESTDNEVVTASSDMAHEEDLLSAVKALRQSTNGTPFHVHGARIQDHVNLLQAAKPKAYKHSLAARGALKAAINSLVSELNTGHNHDRNALNNER